MSKLCFIVPFSYLRKVHEQTEKPMSDWVIEYIEIETNYKGHNPRRAIKRAIRKMVEDRFNRTPTDRELNNLLKAAVGMSSGLAELMQDVVSQTEEHPKLVERAVYEAQQKAMQRREAEKKDM